MRKAVPIREFVKELMERIDNAQTIDCCKEEIRAFTELVVAKMGDDTIEIDWKD